MLASDAWNAAKMCVVYRRENGALVTDLIELDAKGKGRRVVACYGEPKSS